MNQPIGPVALITGGTRGIGLGIARSLAAEGWRLALGGLRALEEVAAVADGFGAFEAEGVEVCYCRGDVADATDRSRIVEEVRERFGTLQLLVNNAGIGVAGNIETCDFDDWKRCFAINVDSIFHGCQKALPLMREHAPGSIVNISSIAGLIASDTMPAYNASKASVWMLSKSIALHCAKNNMQIRCNSVHPTFVDTPILDGTAKNHNIEKGVLMDKLARQIPLKFVGEPNDIANAVVYLASDESRFMTGAELKLDGGISAM